MMGSSMTDCNMLDMNILQVLNKGIQSSVCDGKVITGAQVGTNSYICEGCEATRQIPHGSRCLWLTHLSS